MNEKPWLSEPDFAKWRDPATGLLCAIIRVEFTGALCGYVRVPRGKLYEQLSKYSARRKPRYLKSGLINGQGKKYFKYCGYAHFRLNRIEVHGGLTFGGKIRHYRMGNGYWLGFDCSHAWDLSPAINNLLDGLGIPSPFATSIYRDFAYVKAEVTDLAEQVASIVKKDT